jgi:NAD(P)-dependent dehydrogenase (short-subunit alcohol dehydrogenase family)
VAAVARPGAPLDDTLAAAEQAGAAAGSSAAIPADITRWSDVLRCADETARRFGGIDVLFNTAGTEGWMGSLADYPEGSSTVCRR